jgi:ABC-type Fe3+/spermidine/putrescine transport system ATPase subunit
VPGSDGLAVTGLTAQAGGFGVGPLDLAVPASQVLVLLGPSGAGKTVLLDTIAGLRPARAGQIRLAGADITAMPPERRRIGVVFQDAALFPHLPVRENIAFGLRASRPASRTAADGIDPLLHRLGISHLAARSPRTLSGGERQRVALARALAINPDLLLLDEPLSALDQPSREDLRALLQQILASLDIPAIHVTHDRDEALAVGDRLAIIAAGQLRQTGPASVVTAAPADPDVARLLGWSLLGRGTATAGVVQAGSLAFGNRAALDGPVDIYYRPEEVLLGPAGRGAAPGATLTGQVTQLVLTRPLARVTVDSDPAVTALTLHRDLSALGLRPGVAVGAVMPETGILVFPAR